MDSIAERNKMKKKKWIGRLSIALGVVFLAGGILLFGYNRTIEYLAGKESVIALKTLEKQIKETTTAGSSENKTLSTGNESFYLGILSIPELGLELPVQTNWSYEKLRTSPCVYTGSIQSGGLVIIAHNYRNHFGQLDRLSVGDEVLLMDTTGETYEYLVEEVFSMDETKVEEMVDPKYDLTLFTCNYDGKARITVRLVLQNEKDRYPVIDEQLQ